MKEFGSVPGFSLPFAQDGSSSPAVPSGRRRPHRTWAGVDAAGLRGDAPCSSRTEAEVVVRSSFSDGPRPAPLGKHHEFPTLIPALRTATGAAAKIVPARHTPPADTSPQLAQAPRCNAEQQYSGRVDRGVHERADQQRAHRQHAQRQCGRGRAKAHARHDFPGPDSTDARSASGRARCQQRPAAGPLDARDGLNTRHRSRPRDERRLFVAAPTRDDLTLVGLPEHDAGCRVNIEVLELEPVVAGPSRPDDSPESRLAYAHGLRQDCVRCCPRRHRAAGAEPADGPVDDEAERESEDESGEALHRASL